MCYFNMENCWGTSRSSMSEVDEPSALHYLPRKFRSLLEENQPSDVILIVKSKKVSAHKVPMQSNAHFHLYIACTGKACT